MSAFIHLEDLNVGGESAHYPESLTRMYEVKEFIGRAGQQKSDDIRVGYFTLKPGTNYPPHSHPAPEVYVQLSGKVEWTVDDESRLIERITAVNIAPGVSHSMHNVGDDEATMIYFWYSLDGNKNALKEDAKLDQ